MTIKEKLERLQKELNVNGNAMAEMLGVKKSFYSLVKNGHKKVSPKMIQNLVKLSGETAIYWNGELDKYLEETKSFDKTIKLITTLIESDFIKKPEDIYSDDYRNLIYKALEIDVEHELILKKNKRKKEQ